MKTQTPFRPYSPDQLLLLPPDMPHWLPEDHLVYFIHDVVGQMDLSAIYGTYDGSQGGYPAYTSRDDGGSSNDYGGHTRIFSQFINHHLTLRWSDSLPDRADRELLPSLAGAPSLHPGLPRNYLKKIYLDTISFLQPALMWAYAFQGAKRLILGSDYPHVIGDVEGSVSSIHDLEVPDEEKERSFSENLTQILELSM